MATIPLSAMASGASRHTTDATTGSGCDAESVTRAARPLPFCPIGWHLRGVGQDREIAAVLNERGFRPGASARPGRAADRFSVKHVAYLMHTYGLRSRYDRLRQRGMLNKREMADRLGVHEQTVDRWAKHGLIGAHFYNDHGWQLYEPPGPNTPAKHCSRWDRLVDRAAGLQTGLQNVGLELKEV